MYGIIRSNAIKVATASMIVANRNIMLHYDI